MTVATTGTDTACTGEDTMIMAGTITAKGIGADMGITVITARGIGMDMDTTATTARGIGADMGTTAITATGIGAGMAATTSVTIAGIRGIPIAAGTIHGC